MESKLKTSPFQNRVLSIPEEFDTFLGGGRGGAKSYSLALLALRHCEQYEEKARVLFIRQTYRGLEDFSSITRDLFGTIYGTSARYNASEHIWRLPNGGYFELGQLENAGDYTKYQGRSFTLLLVDEAGQYPTPDLLDKLRSNLRGPEGFPIRQVMAANPGDPGHYWLAKRYVFKSAPWKPFMETDSKKTCVYAPSLYLDNPFIDQEEYRKQLEASCPTDPELLRAWLEGDWTIARGSFFASVIEESRNAVDPWSCPPDMAPIVRRLTGNQIMPRLVPTFQPARPPIGRAGDPRIKSDVWELYLAHDYGSSAPSVTYVIAKSPGAEGPDGRYYPRDSLILIDELATNEPQSLTKGLSWTIPILSEAIIDLSKNWGMKRPEGVADDAIFAEHGHGRGSISEEFRRHGVFFIPAKKADRKTGWEIMRRLLQDAGKPDVPGLYISRGCEYFWSTVPFLGRDPRKTDDVDSRGPDHAADSARYGCLYNKPWGGVVKIVGV